MPDFNKSGGLIPAIIQDNKTGRVLMLGYMNSEALQKTKETGLVTFYSRSKERLWTKGEESGNFLNLVSVEEDCDSDTLLIKVNPAGPVCHTGSDTCWGEENKPFRKIGEADLLQGTSETDQQRGSTGDNPYQFLAELEAVIVSRRGASPESSYTSLLFNAGVKKIAQKVGEEAVELVLEAMDDRDDLFLGESADLLYHLLVLLNAKGFKLSDVVDLLESRSG
ncbi:MAG: bifunctional phosphoribosyl-AMP cyclohydrolase/phosphoribosyl-ATP diphosphatase HisIE [Bacteroidales bacterium]|nr:bifunctional phosphoribosyl-AMP cyclohydrolase/phosphoribosyl-ATP diphosphatase HisIE [Bacteroidales bacterium]